jgi:hypothetical protein
MFNEAFSLLSPTGFKSEETRKTSNAKSKDAFVYKTPKPGSLSHRVDCNEMLIVGRPSGERAIKMHYMGKKMESKAACSYRLRDCYRAIVSLRA